MQNIKKTKRKGSRETKEKKNQRKTAVSLTRLTEKSVTCQKDKITMPIYQMGGTLPPILMEKFITSITSIRKPHGLIPETGTYSEGVR